MSTIRSVLLPLLLVLAGARQAQPATAVPDTSPPASYKLAPPAEALDRQARQRVTRRRWIVAILVGSTVIGGAIGSWSRRRQRSEQRGRI